MGDNPLLRGAILFTAALVGSVIPPVALPLDKLMEGLLAHRDAEARRKLVRFTTAMAETLATIAPHDPGTAQAACLKIEAALQRAPLTHHRLAELNLDPTAATNALAAQLTFATPSERTELEPHCRDLIHRYYAQFPRHAHILQEMLPDLWSVLLQRQTHQGGKLDELLALNRRQIELLEQDKGIPHAALASHLIKLGADERITQAEVPAFLERFANEFVTLREQWTKATNADPGIAAAREEALALLNTGDLDGARQLFRTTRERIRELRQEKAREEATLLADEAAIDRMALRYRDAAALLAQAADLTAFDPETSWRHRLAQASAVHAQGKEFGDNPALHVAIATCEQALAQVPRTDRPDDWATTQNELGNVLQILGERGSGTFALAQAVNAYEGALSERPRDRVPLLWAMTQNNLGNALRALGARQNGTAILKRAVAACEQALQEYTRDRVPLDWAMAQDNLGNALRALGERESGLTTLERAIKAYEQALLERTRERVPLEWAATQNNLGTALQILGERGSGTATLLRAVAAHAQALQERTRERVPLEWAMSQQNLGAALRALGEWKSDTATLARAIEAYEAALLEYTRDRVPLAWATTQNNLGNVLAALGERESEIATLERAISAYEQALLERTRDRVPLEWAATQNNLGTALRALGVREGGTATLERAVKAYEAALQERTRDRVPVDWAHSRYNLAHALEPLADRQGDSAQMQAAIAAMTDAAVVYAEANIDYRLPPAEQSLARMRTKLTEMTNQPG